MTDNDNLDNELENMLGQEAELASPPPIETSISKLSGPQFAALRTIVESEEQRRSGPRVQDMSDGEFRKELAKHGWLPYRCIGVKVSGTGRFGTQFIRPAAATTRPR